jgi:hypothetical protein
MAGKLHFSSAGQVLRPLTIDPRRIEIPQISWKAVVNASVCPMSAPYHVHTDRPNAVRSENPHLRRVELGLDAWSVTTQSSSEEG